MPAAVYRRRGEIEVVEIDTPVPEGDQVLVEVDYCGICGTDLHMVLDGWGSPDTVFGHEWSGRVIEPGGSGLARGTTVVGGPAPTCGVCVHCQANRPSLCTGRSDAGDGPELGAYTRYITRAPDHLVAVPAGIDQRAAAYTEPLAVALHAVTNAAVHTGQRALVFGGGPIGAAITAILVGRGIEVTVAEPGERRRALAERLGARAVAPDDLDVPSHPGRTAADAAHVVFESSGARAAAEVGLTQVTAGGTFVIVGTGMDFPRLDTNRVLLNELHITGAYNYDADGFAAALGLIRSGTLPLDELLEPAAVPLDGVLDAMTRLRAGDLAGKVLVKP